MPLRETRLSRGAKNCLNRVRWYTSQYTRAFPNQKKLAEGLKVGDRQLRRYLKELEEFCTDRCPDCCDGSKKAGHVGLIKVHQGGDGRTALYVLTGALPRGDVRADVRPDVQADVRAESVATHLQPFTDTAVTAENVQAEHPPVVSSSCSSGSSHPQAEQHYSPLVNDAAAERPCPERQSQNPKPETLRKPALDSEIAEIREALKARPLVRWTPAFEQVTRQMLASGETVETIKHAILQGNWLKLSCHDQAFRRGVEDMSLIFSMRYFADVIPAVKGKTDPGYWRNLEERLGREEKRVLGREEYIRHATLKRWNLIDAQSKCETCHGYGHNRDTGEVCACEAGQRLSHHIERQAVPSDAWQAGSLRNAKRGAA
jgi:hypothetical protein